MAERKKFTIPRGNEEGSPQRLLDYVKANAVEGNVSSVIESIDKHCWDTEWHMNVGDVKGKLLDSFVEERSPRIALEFGTYCGYSALRIARKMPEGGKLYTIERNPVHAKVADEMIKFAGMDHKIVRLVGSSTEVIRGIREQHGVECFDFVFFDHGSYKIDLVALEDLNLIKSGSMLVADNCIYPGCPDYLEYVRTNNQKFKTQSYTSKLEYVEDWEDALEKSIYCGNV